MAGQQYQTIKFFQIFKSHSGSNFSAINKKSYFGPIWTKLCTISLSISYIKILIQIF